MLGVLCSQTIRKPPERRVCRSGLWMVFLVLLVADEAAKLFCHQLHCVICSHRQPRQLRLEVLDISTDASMYKQVGLAECIEQELGASCNYTIVN